MRSLSDTGADKAFLPGLSHHDGAVLVITSRPKIEQSDEYSTADRVKLVVSFTATDEATGESNVYFGGSARLIGQATILQTSWNGEPVRARVHTKLTAYNKRTAWLEEAPPARENTQAAKTPDTIPIPRDVRDASADAEAAARAAHYTTGQWNTARKKHQDAMGVTNWHALAEYIRKGSTPNSQPKSVAS